MHGAFSRSIIWILAILLLPAGVGFAAEEAAGNSSGEELITSPDPQPLDDAELAGLAAREEEAPHLMDVRGGGHHDKQGPILGGVALAVNIAIVAAIVAYGLST